MKIKLGSKKINVKVKKSNGICGLMFRKIETSALLLNSDKPIHSFFVFFPFLVLWLNDKNNVVEHKIVMPFSFYEKSKKKFSKIVEIPVSQRYHSVVKFIVGERFKKKRTYNIL